MFMTKDMHAKGPMGKTERLIPMLREHFGRDMALYADANGYYEVDEAIRVGRLLEENKYAYFEEPVMYDDFEAIKKVADEIGGQSLALAEEFILTNAELESMVDTTDEWIASRTGLRERRISHVSAIEMATVAAKRALACAGLDAAERYRSPVECGGGGLQHSAHTVIGSRGAVG